MDPHTCGRVSSHRGAVGMVEIIPLGKEQLSFSAAAEDFSDSWNGQSIFHIFLACLVFSFAVWVYYVF